jgi:N-acetylmuramoyl-L-alanine amidase
MYSVMKKIVLFTVIALFAASPLAAEEKTEVLLRFGQNENVMRIVLEADDNTIKNANVSASLSDIKVEFPEGFKLIKQNGFPLETSAGDHHLSITLKDAEDVVFYKLGGPARIVMDVRLAQKSPDLRMQIMSVLKPEPKSIFLDAGHGGFDYGIASADSKEKDLNLLFTNELNAALSKQGHKVFLTRKADQSVSILDRILLANSKRPDVFISVHSAVSDDFVIYTAVQAGETPDNETSVHLYGLSGRQARHIEKSRALAKALAKSFSRQFKKEVILRELPLPVLVSMNATAVLIEYPSLLLNAYDQKTRADFVNAVVKGLGPDE